MLTTQYLEDNSSKMGEHEQAFTKEDIWMANKIKAPKKMPNILVTREMQIKNHNEIPFPTH